WPNAKIGNPDVNNNGVGRLLVRVGSTNSANGFVGNVDGVVIGVAAGAASTVTRFDFEPSAPTAPIDVTATPGDASASVSWTASADDGGLPVTYTVTSDPAGAVCTVTGTTASCTGLANGVPVTFTVVAANAVGSSAPAVSRTVESSPPVPAHLADFVGVGPVRALDTRPGESPNAVLNVTKAMINPNNVLKVKLADLPGYVPAAALVGAVSLNVTAVNPVAAGFIAVYPCGAQALVSNVNFGANQVVPNAVITPVSDSGEVCFYSNVATDIIVDVNGYFRANQGFHPVSPKRVFDTRAIDAGGTPTSGVLLPGTTRTKVTPAADLHIKITDLPGGVVPATDVGAVSLNVTSTNATADGFITVYPCTTATEVSNVNFSAGVSAANAVITPVSSTGEICFHVYAPTDIIVDVNGWFATTSDFQAAGPVRVFDTRPGFSPAAVTSVPKVQLTPGHDLSVELVDISSAVPANGVDSVSLNVTAANAAGFGFVTAYPCGTLPGVSNLNIYANQVKANAVIVPVSPSGNVCFHSNVATDLIVDVNGWFAKVP
ncbi:MAG: fibronectin type III domain-containing protein, partial [Ilumatobacteraceae bacterium]